jgi:hypothetical protein|tara:strand:+ start:243 stop:575 length:333 start_codon:yes stop_codon:yes gene_type:complete
MTFIEPVPMSGFDSLPNNEVMDAMLANQNMQTTLLQGGITERRLNELESKLDAVVKILYHNRELFEMGLMSDLSPTPPAPPQKTEWDLKMELNEALEKEERDGTGPKRIN